MKADKKENNLLNKYIITDVLDISLWLLSVCFENGVKCDIVSTGCVKIEVEGQFFLLKVKSLKNTLNSVKVSSLEG